MDRVYPLPLTLDRALSVEADRLAKAGVRDVVAVFACPLTKWLVVQEPGDPRKYYCPAECFAEFEGATAEQIEDVGTWLSNKYLDEKETGRGI